MKEEIILLEPVLKETIWGGNRLSEYGYTMLSDHVGEAWAISAHPNGDCTIVSGEFEGKKLSWLWEQHRELFGGCSGEQFPLLTKIIDANDDLSIQVHPDDAYAKEHEAGALGKTECWYVLDACKDATIVIGHYAKSKSELISMIDEGRWHDFIREIPVKKGDFFQIDPGTLHAIKGGTLILETQQNSDITYRVYDYDRLSDGKPRELHLEQSKDVITVPFVKGEFDVSDAILQMNDALSLLVNCDYYQVYKLDVKAEQTICNTAKFLLVSVCEGSGVVNGVTVSKGMHFIVPATVNELSVLGDMMCILSTVAN